MATTKTLKTDESKVLDGKEHVFEIILERYPEGAILCVLSIPERLQNMGI